MGDVTRERALELFNRYIAETVRIYEITDARQALFYGPPASNDYWYISCDADGMLRIGGTRVICISKKAGEIISDQFVGD